MRDSIAEGMWQDYQAVLAARERMDLDDVEDEFEGDELVDLTGEGRWETDSCASLDDSEEEDL